MARLNGTEPVVTAVTSRSKSLRTLPIFVVNHLELKSGNHLNWELDKDTGAWYPVICKKWVAAWRNTP